MSGKFIVIDGCEGSGKSRVLERLRKDLSTDEIVFTRHPGGSDFSYEIRKLVLDDHYADNTHHTLHMAFFAALSDVLDRVVLPNLEKGKTVISDRFDSSMFAYQVSQNNDLGDFFWQIRDYLFKGLEPDYILLDLDPEIGFTRKSAQKKLDHIERRGNKFHSDTREYYRKFADKVGVDVIDASESFEDVYKKVIEKIDL